MTIICVPPTIEAIIAKLLNESKNSHWLQEAIGLSERYRDKRSTTSATKFITTSDEALAYLALRTPSTFAQLYGAMSQVKELVPSWKPRTILDLGSGPGTGTWATNEVWETIDSVTCIERDTNLIKLGKSIFSSFERKILTTQWIQSELPNQQILDDAKYDLVIIGSVLNELNSSQRDEVVKFAADHCGGVLLILEPGTPVGTEVVSESARLIDSSKLQTIAPMTLDKSAKDRDYSEIIFSQKVIRPDYNKRIRQLQRKMEKQDKTSLPPPSAWEEATFSYVAASTFPPEIDPWGRVIDKPVITKSGVEINILTKRGIENVKVSKRDKAKYKYVKKLGRGQIVIDLTT